MYDLEYEGHYQDWQEKSAHCLDLCFSWDVHFINRRFTWHLGTAGIIWVLDLYNIVNWIYSHAPYDTWRWITYRILLKHRKRDYVAQIKSQKGRSFNETIEVRLRMLELTRRTEQGILGRGNNRVWSMGKYWVFGGTARNHYGVSMMGCGLLFPSELEQLRIVWIGLNVGWVWSCGWDGQTKSKGFGCQV